MELRLILVSNCNFNCYFCLNEYYGSKSNERLLNAEQYEKIARCSHTVGVNEITLTGGEPTLRKDLKEIVTRIRPFSKNICMVTNGLLLSKRADVLPMLDELHVSFHSFNNSDWERITKSKGEYRESVQQQIILARKFNPKIRIKLNVVSEQGNKNQIPQYISFAKENGLEINVFQDGFHTMSKMLNIPTNEDHTILPWWDLKEYNPTLVNKSESKETYSIEGVTINLSYTSTNYKRWSSIWVSPKGESYVDIFQHTTNIDLYSILLEDNFLKLQIAFKSLMQEAEMNAVLRNTKSLTIKKKLQSVIEKRNVEFSGSENVPILNLMKK